MKSSSESESVNADVNQATRWLGVSAAVVLVCGVLAMVLPLLFSIGIASLLGWLLLVAAMAHLTYGIHFQRGTSGWHAVVAAVYGLAAISLLVNPLLGVVLLALVAGVILMAEGIVEIGLFVMLREYRHSSWILIDGIITLGLGIVICGRWPPAALDVIQYLVGISFISSGISRLLLAFAIRVVQPTGTPVA